MRNILMLTIILLLGSLEEASAEAHGFKAGAIKIAHPWTQQTLDSVAPAVGYMTLENTGPTDDRLVAASSTAAEEVTMHLTQFHNGITHVRTQLDGIVIPAYATVDLQPGGYHLMLSKLQQPVMLGQMIPLILTFEKAGHVEVMLKVERTAPADHSAHQPMAK